jgi:tetratricopeptide (TPR) repeat protein
MSVSGAVPLPNQQIIWTSFAHRGFVLIGTTLVLFELLFLILYVDNFWLPVDLIPWGIPAVVVMAVAAHLLLLWLESPFACVVLAPIFKRKPPLVYRRWLGLDEMSITFGAKRILWDVIDEASLTIFGNLVLRSRALCGAQSIENGKDKNPAEIVLKLPFGTIPLKSQKQFVEILQSKRPELALNARLTKQIAQPVLKGINQLQGLSVIFLAIVLMDFGYSNFRHLELLKEYFLSEKDSLSGTVSGAKEHYEKAEALRLNPLPISWISRKVMSIGKIAADIDQVRSEALWLLGRKDEAVIAAQSAAEQAPKSFTFRLRLARLYAACGKEEQAKEEITKLGDDHKDSLLPRLYMLAILLNGNQVKNARDSMAAYLEHLDKDVFAPPPTWPPGEAPFLHELFHRDDLEFITQRLLNRK